MRPAAALTVLSCLLLAGCGGSGSGRDASVADPGGGMTLEELWRAPGDDVADHARNARLTSPETSASRFSLSTPRVGWSRFRPRASGSPTGLDESRSSNRARSSSGSACRAEPRQTRSHIYVTQLQLVSLGSTGCSPSPRVERRRCRHSGTSSSRRSDRAPRCRRSGDRFGDSDARIDGRRTSRSSPRGRRRTSRSLEHSIADSLRGEGAVRRHVLDTEVLLQSHVRPGRRRRRGGRASLREAATFGSSMSRSTRATIRRRATTAGCRSGGSRPSRGRFSSDRRARSWSVTRVLSRCNELEQAVHDSCGRLRPL